MRRKSISYNNSITVIRVEHPIDGWGIFRYNPEGGRNRDSIYIPELDDLYDRHGDFNSPSSDGLNVSLGGKEWFCAYSSINQIQRWITSEEFDVLKNNGFIVYMLEVTEHQDGNDQIIFTKESITSKRDITNLFLPEKYDITNII